MDANFGIGTLAWGRKGVIRAGMARAEGAAASRLAAIDTGIATRQVKHLISDPAQGTRNRGETRARHQAPLRQLQREILRSQQESDRLPEMSHRHGARGGERAGATGARARSPG